MLHENYIFRSFFARMEEEYTNLIQRLIGYVECKLLQSGYSKLKRASWLTLSDGWSL